MACGSMSSVTAPRDFPKMVERMASLCERFLLGDFQEGRRPTFGRPWKKINKVQRKSKIQIANHEREAQQSRQMTITTQRTTANSPAQADGRVVGPTVAARINKTDTGRADAPYTRATSFSETSRAAGYSHPGSVVWAGQGSVGFTPGAGRGSGRAVVRQYAGRAVRQGRAGQLGS